MSNTQDKVDADDYFIQSDRIAQTEAPQQKQVQPEKDRPVAGVVYFVAGQVAFSLNFLFAKLVYTSQPDLSTFQLLVLRSIFSTGIMTVKLNKDIKYVMWDSINRDNVGGLVFRTVQGNISIFIQFMCVKYFALTTVGVTQNVSPLITVILAYFILSEKLAMYQIVALIISFIGILIMILGGEVEDQSNQQDAGFWAYLALFTNPLLIATGTIAMRKMRKMHESVVSCYMNLSLGITMAICMWTQGQSLQICNTFSAADWTYTIALSFTVLCSQTFRFKGLANYEASKLMYLSFLLPILQLIYDKTIFDYSFNAMQITGALITSAVYLCLLVKAWFGKDEGTKQIEDTKFQITKTLLGEDDKNIETSTNNDVSNKAIN